MTPAVSVGVSLKMYFTNARARAWFDEVAALARSHDAVAAGRVDLFVIPTYLQIHDALAAFADTRVRVGAQDVAAADGGAYTGEVSAAELAELGVQVAEVGHAERRRLFGETDEVTAAKSAAALRNGLTPVVCVGESSALPAAEAAASVAAQLRTDLHGCPPGPVVVAYEPVWAIGAAEPAPPDHIATVTRALRAWLDTQPDRAGSRVVYGGSAGPGLLARLEDAADGLFLGRFAHEVSNLSAVLDEADVLATRRLAEARA